MKIGQAPDSSLQIHVGNATTAQKAGQAAGANTAASTKATQSAHSAGAAVTVSALSRGLEKTSRRGESSDIDTQKVATVRAAIQNGTYVVNPEAIADKLLSNAQELLDRTNG